MGFKQFLANNWRIVNSNNLFLNRYTNSMLEFPKTGFAKQAEEEKIQLPTKPKKPIPPFFQFLQEKRREVMEKKNINLRDAVREISNMWKTYDEAIKNKMNEEFKHELEIYKQNNLAYKENLTDLQKFEVMRVKYEEMEQKTKRKLKKETKELGKPRKPLTAYLMFVTEQMKNRGDVPVQLYMKSVANKWNEMDTSSRAKYLNASSKENDDYYNALKKWEADMVKAGRSDLVRTCVSDDNTEKF